MKQPATEMIMASSRNWQAGCRVQRAPIAMRMPISRVRSVTETSMIFMMPMPPTSRRNRGNRAEQQRHGAGALFGGVGYGGEVRRKKSLPCLRGMRCRWRSSSVMDFSTAGIIFLVAVCTMTMAHRSRKLAAEYLALAVVSGMMMVSS